MIFDQFKLILRDRKCLKVPWTRLSEYQLNILRQFWVKERKKIDSPYLFVTPNKAKSGYITANSTRPLIYRLRKELNLSNNFSMHSLRHSFATHHLENGVNIIILQHLMGHTALSSTSRYIRVKLSADMKKSLKLLK